VVHICVAILVERKCASRLRPLLTLVPLSARERLGLLQSLFAGPARASVKRGKAARGAFKAVPYNFEKFVRLTFKNSRTI